MQTRTKRVLAIVNPAAQFGRAKRRWLKALPGITDQLGPEFQVAQAFTTKNGDAEQFAFQAAQDRIYAVLVVGGDGTINEVINGLLRAAQLQEDAKRLPRKMLSHPNVVCCTSGSANVPAMLPLHTSLQFVQGKMQHTAATYAMPFRAASAAAPTKLAACQHVDAEPQQPGIAAPLDAHVDSSAKLHYCNVGGAAAPADAAAGAPELHAWESDWSRQSSVMSQPDASAGAQLQGHDAHASNHNMPAHSNTMHSTQHVFTQLCGTAVTQQCSGLGQGTLCRTACLQHSYTEWNTKAADSPVHCETALCVLPWGTGCDWARSFKWDRHWQSAIQRLKNGDMLPVDLAAMTHVGDTKSCRPLDCSDAQHSADPSTQQHCQLTHATSDAESVGISIEWTSMKDRYFANIASLGISALAVQLGCYFKWMGSLGFAIAGLLACLVTPLRRCMITVDGEAQEFHCSLVIVAKGAFFGGGMRVAPRAEPNSGLLEVIVLRDTCWADYVFQYHRLYSGKQDDWPKLVNLRGRHVCVTPLPNEGDLRGECDGELMGKAPASFRVLPGALRVLV